MSSTNHPATHQLCTSRMAGSVITALVLSMAIGCGRNGLPDESTGEYEQVVSLFYSAMARVRIGDERGAEYRLKQATSLAPDEPSLWYNLALLSMRKGDFDNSGGYLETARSLEPGNARILLLSGHLERQRDQTEKAMEFLRRSADLEPTSLKTLFALAKLLGKSESAQHRAESGDLLDRILELQKSNAVALIERARNAIRNGESERLQESVTRLADVLANWPLEVQEPVTELLRIISLPDSTGTFDRLLRLENHLKRYPAYRHEARVLEEPDHLTAGELTRFLRLSMPAIGPAPADTSLIFSIQELELPDTSWNWIGVPVLTDSGYPVTIAANARQVHIDPDMMLPFPGGDGDVPPFENSVVPVDFDYDFRMDLALVGAGGLRLYRQTDTGLFVDATESLGLQPSIIRGAYRGGWAIDLESEGDMDLILATASGAPLVLRNNGDGSFAPISVFGEVRGVRDLIVVDVDTDGDLDPVILDASGRLHFFRNEGSGKFRKQELPLHLPRILAIAASDMEYNGAMDLLLLLDDGRLVSVDPVVRADNWSVVEVLDGRNLISATSEPGAVQIITGDMDNNGALDIVLSGAFKSSVWLRDVDGDLQRIDLQEKVRIFEAMDLIGVGRLDFVGLTESAQPVHWMNMAQNQYLSTTLRPRTAEAFGDRRINSFGIGGKVEILSGLHYQTRTITGPVVHFGLGEQNLVDAVRIIWPNGASQNEFDVESDQAILAREGLTSSCPWVFAFNGEETRFVSDFLMRSPLGLRSNADETVDVVSPEDRIIIRGDQLVEKDGFYSLSIAAELWETLYIDHVSLVAVDHPSETDIFLNEFYTIPPPPLDANLTDRQNPISGAWDQSGRDVTEILKARDEQYLEGFEVGTHLGQAYDHYVEIDLGSDAPMSGPLWLVANGWLRATVSSVNIAVSQAKHTEQGELWLEVQGRDGAWTRVRTEIGLPYGMFKTGLFDLSDVFRNSLSPRLRLRTNREIYWDQISWTTPLPDARIRKSSLGTSAADLRYRGFSLVTTPGRAHPEVPTYDVVASTRPVWRELSGYYTRYGDVRPLLNKEDDRYVIMNPGDELVLKYAAPDPPPDGWIRDYILNGVGWTKDGDLSTRFSKTVLPLPDHRSSDYATPPGRLEEDPVYIRHTKDWQTYHTRYVSSEVFNDVLTSNR